MLCLKAVFLAAQIIKHSFNLKDRLPTLEDSSSAAASVDLLKGDLSIDTTRREAEDDLETKIADKFQLPHASFIIDRQNSL